MMSQVPAQLLSLVEGDLMLERMEISGVLLTDAYVKSFGLFFSTFTGRLTHLDIPLLRRDHGGFAWFPWAESMHPRIHNNLPCICVHCSLIVLSLSFLPGHILG